jgi:hypothetical protein
MGISILMGKIVLTYDQLELRPALANELSSKIKGPLYVRPSVVSSSACDCHYHCVKESCQSVPVCQDLSTNNRFVLT